MRLDTYLLNENAINTKIDIKGKEFISKKEVENALASNGYDINVDITGKKIPYISSNSKIPLYCKKDNNKFNISLDKLNSAIKNKKEVCAYCAQKKNQQIPSVLPNSEIDVKNGILQIMSKVFGKSKDVDYKIHYGLNKVESNYSSFSGKHKLDYDITIDDKNDNKTIHIAVNGPSHNPWNVGTENNDTIRAASSFKDNKNFLITSGATKNNPLFNETLQQIEQYVRSVYEEWSDPSKSKKALQLQNTINNSSRKLKYRGNLKKAKEYYSNYLTGKEEKLQKHIENAKEKAQNSGIQTQVYELVNSLLKRVGYENLAYSGKYDNLIDYLLKDSNAKHSVANNHEKWSELYSLSKNGIKSWMNKYQMKSHDDPKTKLFEDKKAQSID